MKVIPYDTAKHEQFALEMLKSQSMSPILVYDLPAYGLIAIEDDKPIAMGFIRRMEGSYGFMDSYLSHKHAKAALRNRALDIITRKLISTARASGQITKLIAFSSYNEIVERSIRHGFWEVSYRTAIIHLV